MPHHLGFQELRDTGKKKLTFSAEIKNSNHSVFRPRGRANGKKFKGPKYRTSLGFVYRNRCGRPYCFSDSLTNDNTFAQKTCFAAAVIYKTTNVLKPYVHAMCRKERNAKQNVTFQPFLPSCLPPFLMLHMKNADIFNF